MIRRLALDMNAACIGVCLLIVTMFWMQQLTPELLVNILQFFGEFDFLAAIKGGNSLDPNNFIN